MLKKTQKFAAIFMACALTLSTSIIKAPSVKADVKTPVTTAPTVSEKSASQKYVEAMGNGWNLGNSFDSFDTNGDKGEQSWGNPVVTKQLIHKIKTEGFKSIRIPFTSNMRTGAAPNYKIDPKFLARYAEVVKWSVDEGLYVMVNIHHDSWVWANDIGKTGDNNVSIKRYEAIWAQLASYFKNYSDKVCFESLNEPQFKEGDTANQIKIIAHVNQIFYKLVRNSGGKNATRMLVMPTLNTNDSDDRCESLYNTIKGFNDKNIIATFHYYGFWPFSTNIAGTTTMNDQVVTELKAAFDRMYNHFTANGIGVVCGEYGLLGFDKSENAIENGELLKYFNYINNYARAKNIGLMLWDNGNVIDRTKLTWKNQSLNNMVKASWKTNSSYSESDRVFVKDQNKTKDLSIKLTLNGNKLVSIYNGSKKLVLGKDYTYAKDTVVLKGSYVNSLITNVYGTNATLTMKFSAGADWNVYLVHYAAPSIPGVGTTDGFDIPVQFNGSKLSTLEAVYADGTSAGPQNWTTYKEYDSAFTVNYETSKVTITNKFFAEAKDGEITFKLHFQSGEVSEYKVVKTGTVVKAIN